MELAAEQAKLMPVPAAAARGGTRRLRRGRLAARAASFVLALIALLGVALCPMDDVLAAPAVGGGSAVEHAGFRHGPGHTTACVLDHGSLIVTGHAATATQGGGAPAVVAPPPAWHLPAVLHGENLSATPPPLFLAVFHARSAPLRR